MSGSLATPQVSRKAASAAAWSSASQPCSAVSGRVRSTGGGGAGSAGKGDGEGRRTGAGAPEGCVAGGALAQAATASEAQTAPIRPPRRKGLQASAAST